MNPMKQDKDSSLPLGLQIRNKENLIKQHKIAAGVHAEEARFAAHDLLASPATIGVAFCAGFLLDRSGVLRSEETRTPEEYRDQYERPETKESGGTSLFLRIQGVVTIATATLALLKKLDDYLEQLNRKSNQIRRQEELQL